MTDSLLTARLVEALVRAQHELLLLNGCHATNDPDVPARLPAELKPVFWQIDAGEALMAAEEALCAAEAAGFAPRPLDPPKPPAAS